jgi:tRNA (adenine57-N1/adenine58-N1)-methyltransferase
MIDRNFRYGDRVQLTDAKGKLYSITLTQGLEWHTHKGMLKHDDLVGKPEGSIVATNQDLKFQAFRPLLADYVLSMPRGATIVYPKDAAIILGVADIKPGIRVLEAGVGSGALSISLLRAIGEKGELHSVETRTDFAEIAEKNVASYFGGKPNNWNLTIGALQDQTYEADFDRVVLDMLSPWECLEVAAKALVPGGVLIAYVATTTQLSKIAEAIKESGNFTEPESSETIVRSWHHAGLAVRPQHRMIGHTGFLIFARQMAPGVAVLQRRRRASKGSCSAFE